MKIKTRCFFYNAICHYKYVLSEPSAYNLLFLAISISFRYVCHMSHMSHLITYVKKNQKQFNYLHSTIQEIRNGLKSPGLNTEITYRTSEVAEFSAVNLDTVLGLDNSRHCLCPDAQTELCSALHNETTIPIQEHNPTVLPSYITS